MKNPLAAIISYNGIQFLPACINSCLTSGIETLVIDNKSNDGSIEYLQSFKEISLIKNSSNTGFTKAANQALDFGINNGFDYLLLLNQDTEFDSEMIPSLLKDFEENPSLAIVSPMQLNEQNKPEYQFNLNCIDFGIDFSSTKTSTIEVPFVNAACWMMDLKKVREIGLFYPIFKNYGSDLNYCHRVIFSGYKVGINTYSEIFHKKEDLEYQKDFFKTIKLQNTYYLALILNPQTQIKIKLIIYALSKGAIANLLKLRVKKALLNTFTLIFLFQKIIKIKKIKK